MYPVQVTITVKKKTKKDLKKTWKYSTDTSCFIWMDACQCWLRDLMDIIENGMVTDNVGLNFSEPHSIIGQNHDICWAYSVMHTTVVAWKLGHVLLWFSMLTCLIDLGIWSLQQWSCVVFGEFIVYLHFLCVLHLHYSNHWEVELF